ncbi:isoprenylcysteine carboxylmethyltransferase family protein [Candidatus Sumerlaeota bacterium]|nr:isoprenylcysteine carboxylmethyltransferase family protein [Candidatus Sumerlaeota bacterium]
MMWSVESKAAAIVAIQIASATLIVLAGPIWPLGGVARGLLVASGLLLAWAVAVLWPGRFNVRPIPHRRARLVTRGPYRLIRHPMYLSVLVFAGAFVAAGVNPWRIALWLVLLVDLVFKMRMEERLLAEKLAGYRDYMKKTRRLVPWVY